MSRYKKASYNEKELEAIDGVKAILRPTRDEVFEVITLFKDQQKNKDLDLKEARKVIGNLLFNSLYLWENNQRTNKKEVGSEDVTKDDIDDFVVKHVFELWLGVLDGLQIIDKKKLEEVTKQIADQKQDNENPN